MFYLYVKWFFAPLVRIYLRLKVRGHERVPRRGPVIMVANHASFLDPVVLGSACSRPIHFMVLQSMYDWWWLRWFYWGMQTIPVRTEESDPRAIKQALSRLKNGEVVGLFPEGGRSTDGKLMQGKEGAALLAAVSGAPVIPCFIHGAFESFPPGAGFPRPSEITIRFGEPLQFPREKQARRDRKEMERFSASLLGAIARLQEEETHESLPGGRGERAASPRVSGKP